MVWALLEGVPYPWNPQNHLLYHYAVERGWALWKLLAGGGPSSVHAYLKVFSALAGLGYLLALRLFLRELSVAPAQRAVLLALAGLSVAAWFHFSVPESHALAMPAIALYGVALLRLRRGGSRSARERALLVGALVFCGLVRVDLWRLALVSLVLPLLPRLRAAWRTLTLDLVAVAGIGAVATSVLAWAALGVPLSEGVSVPFTRGDRPDLAARLAQPENLTAANLWSVSRAASVYAFLMPVAPQVGERPLYAAPLTGFLRSPHSLPAVVGVLALLLATLAASAGRAARGDPLHQTLLLQVAFGLWLYTWFNPWEPSLWVLEFLALTMLALPDVVPRAPRAVWIGLALLTLAVGLHNLEHFYLAFR